MEIPERLVDRLREERNSAELGILLELQLAKPDDAIRELILVTSPNYDNASVELRQAQKQERVHDVLWAAGEIANAGQHVQSAPLNYYMVGGDVAIQSGQAWAVVQLLDRLFAAEPKPLLSTVLRGSHRLRICADTTGWSR